MKKLIYLLLAVIMTAFLFGCADDDKKTNHTTKSFMTSISSNFSSTDISNMYFQSAKGLISMCDVYYPMQYLKTSEGLTQLAVNLLNKNSKNKDKIPNANVQICSGYFIKSHGIYGGYEYKDLLRIYIQDNNTKEEYTVEFKGSELTTYNNQCVNTVIDKFIHNPTYSYDGVIDVIID